MVGEGLDMEGVEQFNRKHSESVEGDLVGNEALEVLHHPEAPQARLDGHFPGAGGTEEYLVITVGDNRPGGDRKPSVVTNCQRRTLLSG